VSGIKHYIPDELYIIHYYMLPNCIFVFMKIICNVMLIFYIFHKIVHLLHTFQLKKSLLTALLFFHVPCFYFILTMHNFWHLVPIPFVHYYHKAACSLHQDNILQLPLNVFNYNYFLLTIFGQLVTLISIC
jgi:hypothetical protein